MPGIGDYGSSQMRAASKLVTEMSTMLGSVRLDEKLKLENGSSPEKRFEALSSLVNTGMFPDNTRLSEQDVKDICKSVSLRIPKFGNAKKSLKSALAAYKIQSLVFYQLFSYSTHPSSPNLYLT